jgi:hypothetical protein
MGGGGARFTDPELPAKFVGEFVADVSAGISSE